MCLLRNKLCRLEMKTNVENQVRERVQLVPRKRAGRTIKITKIRHDRARQTDGEQRQQPLRVMIIVNQDKADWPATMTHHHHHPFTHSLIPEVKSMSPCQPPE